MHAWMYVCMYVCMYVDTYACTYIMYIHVSVFPTYNTSVLD